MMLTLLALSVLVLMHELGHFAAAKMFGIRVLEFGLGLPPKALTIFKRGGTEYSLNWLPLGGFVRLFGEQGELAPIDKLIPFRKEHAFSEKPAWQRSIVLLSGVFVNLLIGVFLFGFIYTVLGVPESVGEQVVIADVVKDSPAELSGIKSGEVVVRVGDREIKSSDEFVEIIASKKGEMVNLYIAQEGNIDISRVVPVIPRVDPPEGQGALGVSVAQVPVIAYDKKPWYSAPFYGMVIGLQESIAWAREILRGINELFIGIIKGSVPEGLSGPVGVVKAGEVAQELGYLVFLRYVAIISINLGIFNLLPIPALDGGRLLFVGLEKVIGKKRVQRTEGYVNGVGFLLLIGLILWVTWMDLFR